MEDEKKDQRPEEEKKELNLDDLELVAGGELADDIECFFGSHDWTILQSVHATEIPIAYFYQKCTNCGKTRYIVKNTDTGDYKTVSEEAFNNAGEMIRKLTHGTLFDL